MRLLRYATFSAFLTVLVYASSSGFAADIHGPEFGRGAPYRGYYYDDRYAGYEPGYRGAYDRARSEEYKEEFRAGACKIERKWERDGSYREKTDCESRRWY